MRVLSGLFMLFAFGPRITGQMDSSAPECATRCWGNTKYKYVSKCLDDVVCLCSEVGYQNSVFQCLYSQCDTSHFGSALHHAISQCFGTGNEFSFTLPPIPNRDSLRRREAEYAAGKMKLAGSGSGIGYPTESVGFPTQSVQYSYATESAGLYPPSPSPSSSIPFFPLITALSVLTGAAPSERSFDPIPETESASDDPQLFTGLASTSRPAFSILSTIVGLYLIFWWLLALYVL